GGCPAGGGRLDAAAALRLDRSHAMPLLRFGARGADDDLRAQRLPRPHAVQEPQGPLLPPLRAPRLAPHDRRDPPPRLAGIPVLLHRAYHGAHQPGQPSEALIAGGTRARLERQDSGRPGSGDVPAPGRLRVRGRGRGRPADRDPAGSRRPLAPQARMSAGWTIASSTLWTSLRGVLRSSAERAA